MDGRTLGIISLVLAFILAPIGFILGIVALLKINKSGAGEGKGFAIAAIVIAILIALLGFFLVLGATAYFGVVSPAKLLPEKCAFPLSLSCTDFSVGEGSIAIILQNGAGRNMIVDNIRFSGSALPGGCVAEGQSVENGEAETFRATECSFIDIGTDKIRLEAEVSYAFEDSPGIVSTMQGEILARAP